MKFCIKCLLEKPLDAFEKSRNCCKSCRNKAKKDNNKNRYYEITIKEKFCPTCKEIKPASQFSKKTKALGGLNFQCRSCRSNSGKITYQNNKNYYIKKSKEYYEKNKGSERLKKSTLKRQAERLKTDPLYTLSRRLRNRLYYALKKTSWKKNTKFSEYIGCSLEELKLYIEKQFVGGMSWENKGQWHIDHIIPLDSAKTEEELYQLCHYTNLKPMWAIDNIKKGNKIIY